VGIHIRDARTALVNEFMSSMPGKACANCQAVTVSLRREGFVKIFQKALSKKARQSMASMGLSFESALKMDERLLGERVRSPSTRDMT
jgi:DNA-directed RNA polymerase I subunit RPA1